MSVEPVELAAPGVEAVVVPQLGGRLLSLRFDGREQLWRDHRLLDDRFQPRVPVDRAPLGAGFARWQNWGGGKAWPAPQGWERPDAWPGPPDGVLDAGMHTVLERTGASVRLRSAVEPRTGLRIERELHAEPRALVVRSSLRNEAEAPARWAAWEVTQFTFDERDLASDRARIDVGMAGESEPVVLFEPVGRIRADRIGDIVRVPFQQVVGKLGFPRAAGRAELIRADGTGVIMTFSVATGGDYVDDAPFQLWMQTPVEGPLPGLDGLGADAAYVELEALSPLTLLAPGEAVGLEVRWEAPRR